MIKTVLFDLDGTLVHFDYDEFLRAYLGALGRKVADLVEPKGFIKELMASTETMMGSTDPSRTNMEVFWADFPGRIGVPQDVLLPLLNEFYLEDFPKLSSVLGIEPLPEARRLLEDLLAGGYEVVIATNPVFPAVAIEERMAWGGIRDLPYSLVTTYETSHYCKPNVEYYREILQKLNRQPKECLMVGNNTWEDLVAKDLGIYTYLVEDCLLDVGPFQREPHYRGEFSDLLAFFADNVLRAKAK